MDFQQTNILSMTGNDNFATTGQLANYVDLTTNQTIASGAIKTFTTLPQSSAVPTTANMLVNKNYVDGLGTNYVTLTGIAQTISSLKTFSSDVRINNTKNLILGTSTGAVLNFTGGNMYIDNQAAGGIYFFVSGLPNTYIDSTGLNIESGKRIWFNGARCSITDNGTQLVYDVPTGNSHSFRTNNTQRVAISADTNGTLFTFPAGTIMREYTSFNWFLYQLPAGHTLIYQAGGTNIMEVSIGGVVMYEKLSMRNNKQLVWDEGFSNIAYITKNTTLSRLDYEVATGYSHRFSVNNVSSATIDASGVIINSTAVSPAVPTQKLYLSVNKANYIDANTLDLRYNCSASGSHQFYQNNTTLLGFINNTSMTLSPNNISFQMGTSSPIQFKHDTASSQLQYRTLGSYFHDFFINGTQHFEMNTSGVITNVGGYRAKNGVSGALDPVYIVISWDGSRSHIWINNTDLGGTAIASDYRLKENIRPARPVLDKLCSIPMREFEYKDIGIWKKGKGINYGIIAHELQEAFPEYENLVSCEKDKLTCDGDIQPQSLTSAMNLLFMGSIQELNAKCIAQQAQMEAMQKQIEAQQAQIDGLLVAMSKLVSQQIV